MKKIKNGYILAFVLGAILFGGISYVVATSTSSSTILYETNNNSNIENLEDALDDLYDQIIGHPEECYNGHCGKLTYVYWNANFNNTQYNRTSVPTGSGINGVFTKRSLLANEYSGFANRSFYIRTVKIDDSVVGHELCLYYNNKSACFNPTYWGGTICDDATCYSTTAGTKTKIKLKRDLEEKLGVTIQDSSCSSSNNDAYCFVGKYYFTADSWGGVGVYDCDTNNDSTIDCSDNPSSCIVNASSTAYCR